MSWRPAGRASIRHFTRLLKVEEWRHVALTSRLRNSGGVARFGQVSDGRLWINDENNKIDGGVFFSRYGVLLPAYDHTKTHGQDDDFLSNLYHSRRDKLFSIIGMENRVKDVERRLGEVPPDAESYRMFTRDHATGTQVPLPHGTTLHRATTADLDLLWPLERSYQMEEVIRPGSRLNERHGRRFFLNTLKTQEVYYVLRKGIPVAKAGTNARGWEYDQIGGVFVEPALRGQGYGKAVMEQLLLAIRTAGRRPCLFVKTSNLAAQRLYGSLSFQDRGAFRISYWV